MNSFVRRLNRDATHVDAKGVVIQWVPKDEEQHAFFHSNRLVIRLREHKDQDKNFVNASMVFVSKSLLPRTKKYMSKTQSQALDLFTARKLFETEKPRVVDQFFDDYFSQVLGDRKMMDLLEKFEAIDKVGVYFFMLIQELSFLGEKVFYRPKGGNILQEVASFIDFLETYANRQVGDETVPLTFQGAYCRTAIVIVARRTKREKGDIRPYVAWLGTLLSRKLEQIYVFGSSGTENMRFIHEIVQQATLEHGLSEHSRTEFDSRIKIAPNRREEIASIVVLLRSSDTKKYYDAEYQDEFIDEATITTALE